jgi:hypothetical protein
MSVLTQHQVQKLRSSACAEQHRAPQGILGPLLHAPTHHPPRCCWLLFRCLRNLLLASRSALHAHLE